MNSLSLEAVNETIKNWKEYAETLRSGAVPGKRYCPMCTYTGMGSGCRGCPYYLHYRHNCGTKLRDHYFEALHVEDFVKASKLATRIVRRLEAVRDKQRLNTSNRG